VALKSLLKSVDPPLVYKKDGDVYIISVKKPEPSATDIASIENAAPVIDTLPVSEDMIIEKISLNFLDASIVKDLLDGKVTQNNNQNGGMGGGMSGFGNMGGGMSGFGNSGSSFGGTGSSGSSWGGNSGSSNMSGGFRGF
jgi:hypothetical protein